MTPKFTLTFTTENKEVFSAVISTLKTAGIEFAVTGADGIGFTETSVNTDNSNEAKAVDQAA